MIFIVFVLLIALQLPFNDGKCIKVENLKFQDQYFYDLYSTVLTPHLEDEFWNIVHQKKWTKSQIFTHLNQFSLKAKGIFDDVRKNFLQHQTERILAAQKAIQESKMSPEAKTFAQQSVDEIYAMSHSWEQTCQRNNALVEQQPQKVLDELESSGAAKTIAQGFINGDCMSQKQLLEAKRKYVVKCGDNNNKGGDKNGNDKGNGEEGNGKNDGKGNVGGNIGGNVGGNGNGNKGGNNGKNNGKDEDNNGEDNQEQNGQEKGNGKEVQQKLQPNLLQRNSNGRRLRRG
ncbi:hypothetical protein M3Y95_00992700 [Aphelenchoides besseyi]|nr:hypothetical protein M3Y95_00992700 [Aphelenchoides besseyi]